MVSAEGYAGCVPQHVVITSADHRHRGGAHPINGNSENVALIGVLAKIGLAQGSRIRGRSGDRGLGPCLLLGGSWELAGIV